MAPAAGSLKPTRPRQEILDSVKYKVTMQAWEEEIVGIIGTIVVVAIYCSCISVAHYISKACSSCLHISQA